MKKQINKEYIVNLEHSNKMEEIKFKFECEEKIEKLKHENEKESQRIKNASILRTIDRKNNREFMESYSK